MFYACILRSCIKIRKVSEREKVRNAQILVNRSLVFAIYSVRILATGLIDSNHLILPLFFARLMSAAATLYEYFSEKNFVLTEGFL